MINWRSIILLITILYCNMFSFSQIDLGIYPESGAIYSDSVVYFKWNKVGSNVVYQFLIAEDDLFSEVVIAETISDNSITINSLDFNKKYFWKVQGDFADDFFSSITYSFSIIDIKSLPGLSLWLSAEKNVKIDDENGVISWTNLVDEADTAYQTNDEKRPLFVNNDSLISRKSAIYFDGENDFLINSKMRTYGAMFVFTRWSGNELEFPENSGLAGAYGSIQPKPYFFLGSKNTTNFYLYSHPWGTTGIYINQEQTFDFSPISQYKICSGQTTTPLDFSGMVLGSTNGAASFWKGAISEILTFDSIPSDSIQDIIHDYLRFQFAKPANLGSDYITNYNIGDTTITPGFHFTDYLWSTGDTTTSLTVTEPGKYWVDVIDIFGFPSSDTIEIWWPQINNISDTAFCIGDTLIWDSEMSNDYTYEWYKDEIQIISNEETSLEIYEPGEYYLILIDTAGNSSFSDTVIVEVDDFELTTSLGNDTLMCIGSPISLIYGANEAISYLWNDLFTDSIISFSEERNYWVKVTNLNHCIAFDTISITSKGFPPEPEFTPLKACSGEIIEFSDLSVSPEDANIVNWEWSFGDGETSTDQNPSHTYSENNVYNLRLKVETDQGCEKEISADFAVNKVPIAKIYNPLRDKVFKSLPNKFFDASFIDTLEINDSIISWLWLFGDETFSIDQNPFHQYDNFGSYNVSLKVGTTNGCYATSILDIAVVEESALPGDFSLLEPLDNYLTEDTNLVFSWNKSSGATYYKILLSDGMYFENILESQDNILTTSHTISDLESNTRYFWKVIAYNNYADSSISNTLSFTITNPKEFPKIVLWLKAGSGITMQADSSVNNWENLVGDNSFSQAVNENRPKFFVSTELNNNPVIRFDGTDDFLNGGNVHNIGFNSRNIFIVGKSNMDNCSFLAKAYIPIFSGASNIFSVFIFNNKLNYVYQDISEHNPSSSITLGKNYLIQTKTDRIGLKNDLFLNGVLKSSKTGIEGIDYNMTNTNRFLLGAYNYVNDVGQTSYLNGDIAEILIMDTVLTDNETVVMYNYLRNKYSPPLYLGEDINIAYGFEDTTFNAPEGYNSYLWNTGSSNSSILISNPGIYWLSVTDAFNYSSVDTIQVNYPEINRFYDTTICLYDTIYWKTGLSNDYDFLWQDNSTDSLLVIYEEGYYNVFVTDSFGNSITSDIIYVKVDSFPIIPSLGPELTICKGDEIGIISGAENVSAYLWKNGSTDSLLKVETTDDYSVVLIDSNNCYAYDTIRVNVSGIVPEANYISNNFCVGDNTEFISTSIIEDPFSIISWDWDFGDGTFDNGSSVNHIFTQPGSFDVKLSVESSEACSSSITKEINIDDLQASFVSEPDSIACTNVPVSFYDISKSSYYIIDFWLWNFGDGFSSTYQNPLHSFNNSGNYTIELESKSKQDCESYFSDHITVVDQYLKPEDFTLIEPANNSYKNDTSLTFSWNESENSFIYTFQMATDASFENIIIEIDGLDTTSITISFEYIQKYSWRVIAQNICKDKTTSPHFVLYLFRENTIPSLELWLNANIGVEKNDSTVFSWLNQAGNGKNAFQASFEASQPVLIDSAPNSTKAIHFDGVNDYLEIDSMITVGTSFIVANWSGNELTFPTVNGMLTGKETSNLSMLFGVVGGTSNLYSSGYYGNEIYVNQEQSFDFSPISNYKLVYGTKDPQLFNGLFVSRNRIYNNYWKGNVAEILIYNKELNQQEIDKVVQYLHYKYAPPVNLGLNVNVAYGFEEIELCADGEFTDFYWSTGEDTSCISVNESGFYSVTVTDIFEFESEDVIKVTYPIINQIYNSTLCLGDTLVWNSGLNNDYTFTWQDNSTKSYFNITEAGFYSVAVSDSFGNQIFSDTVQITVDSFPIETGFFADTTLCIGSMLSLDYGAENVVSYQWNNGSEESNIEIEYEGNYSLITRNTNGCYSYDTIYVDTIGFVPIVDFAADTVCFGENTFFIDLSESGDNSSISVWNWDFGDGNTSNEQNPAYSFNQSYLNSVTLKVSTGNYCENRITKTVKVFKLPEVDFEPDMACSGNEIQFKDLSESEESDINLRIWNINDEIINDELIIEYIFNSVGTFPVSLYVENENGCNQELIKEIDVLPGVNADFEFSPACYGENIYFEDLSNSFLGLEMNWNWNFGDENNSELNNPIHLYDSIGTYPVTLSVSNTSNGCVDSITKQVTVYPNPVAKMDDFLICEKTTFSYSDSSSVDVG